MLRLRIICNPRAAGGRKADLLNAVIVQLQENGARVELLSISRTGEAARHVRETNRSDTDRLVIAGRDGTINDALQGFDADAPPFAIIPTGTANVLAHELGLKTSAHDLAHYVLNGRIQSAFPGRVNERRFLSLASVGSDARAVADLPRGAKRKLGKLAYVIHGLGSFARHGSPAFCVYVNGIQHKVSIVIANKGSRYGGNYVIAPSARIFDQDMVATLFPPSGWIKTFFRLLMIALGQMQKKQRLPQVPCSRIDIPGPDGAPVQADGDIVGYLPATITVETTPVYVITP